ncbi:PIN domain-containing protein [Nostoc flagelliforme FACHB-838]|uniref:PIN domain-containing protein n=1 Tax=Nostoc flagelliforme FACHB-838 TaxID=2692904 RepID=A0ABR8DR26_9NOSO|nr:PIN domain-containing protein [Nostoc flagelliforme]MBD2531341.1 PIN domain-containing protein [Nostoc flagelliforme FACHB-838]
MPSVILDACVLFPMYLRDTLLTTAEFGLYMPYWSQKILNEAMDKLVLKDIVSAELAKKLQEAIKTAFPEAMVEQVPWEIEAAMTNHPKDRHVLAAAMIARADIIVTNNIKDFSAKALAPLNIKAQSPDNFLSDLFDKYPEEMVQVVQRQSSKYKRKPQTADELLELLSKQIPVFTAKILLHEYGESIFNTTKKALKIVGRPSPESGKYLEGERYRVWRNREILTITAKDNRGKIVQVKNRKIEGKLSSLDVKAF